MVITSESDEDDTKPSEEEIRKAEIAAIKETPPPPPPEFTDQEESILSFSEDVSDFDISAHLPGTDINETFKLEEKISSPRRASGTDLSNAYLPRDEPPRQPSPRVVSKIPLTREPSRSNSVTSDTTGPSVTSHGFWVLVKAVEDDLRECLSPHKIYRSQKCSPTIKTEIVKSANEGHTLEHIDPAAVSMVMLNELPLLIHDIEHQRLLLEEQLNAYLRSNDRLSKLKASKLQSYWKKICEDERKSRVRNEQLLRDFSRLESYITAMSKKTDRLRTLKNDYEAHIERLYPKWKETLEQQYMFNHVSIKFTYAS
uniref:Centrosomal protein kizuna n=1 Tax=Saccoglossus kowalevskii TaxID=10224 RepID=A0ABM0MZ40_SACKO|nr:PREDICTED: uncharacterized protein LOC100372498 [Saccoglossus kowalevskii]